MVFDVKEISDWSLKMNFVKASDAHKLGKKACFFLLRRKEPKSFAFAKFIFKILLMSFGPLYEIIF
jgi:hypothetical protein